MYGDLDPVRSSDKTSINHNIHAQRATGRRRVVRGIHISPHRPGRPHNNLPTSTKSIGQGVRDRQTGMAVPLGKNSAVERPRREAPRQIGMQVSIPLRSDA